MIGVAFIGSLVSFRILWAAFTGALLLAIVLPPLANRNLNLMLPWELILISAIPVLARFSSFSALSSQVATYFALATFSLIIIVELDIFTSLKLNSSFAIALVLTGTLALGALWSLLQFWYGEFTSIQYIPDNTALMYDYLNITLTGLMAGIAFDLYFKRRDRDYGGLTK